MVLIDDDELSRAVLGLVAREAGFDASSFETGEAALEAILAGNLAPAIVLSDMQMPGVSGNKLAARLREVCGGNTRLLAISGSKVSPEATAKFDGFLLKPISAGDLRAASQSPLQPADTPAATSQADVLSEPTYQKFAHSMPPAQLAGLYRMCLDDAQKRLQTMRRAVEEQDDAGYRRAAHAIKGGCGMVGALELARVAASMETNGLPGASQEAPFEDFLTAHARLERMLDNKANSAREDPAAVVRSQ